MERKTFDEAVAWLLKHYGVTRDTESVWNVFQRFEDSVFIAAIHRILGEQTAFPTIVQIGQAVADAEEERAGKRGQERNDRMPYVNPGANMEMGRRAVNLIERTRLPERHRDKLTQKQLAILMITEMEVDYPGKGWEKEGRRLLAWSERQGTLEQKRQASIFIERRQKVR